MHRAQLALFFGTVSLFIIGLNCAEGNTLGSGNGGAGASNGGTHAGGSTAGSTQGGGGQGGASSDTVVAQGAGLFCNVRGSSNGDSGNGVLLVLGTALALSLARRKRCVRDVS